MLCYTNVTNIVSPSSFLLLSLFKHQWVHYSCFSQEQGFSVHATDYDYGGAVLRRLQPAPCPPSSGSSSLVWVTVQHSPPGGADIQTGLTSNVFCAYRSLGGFVEAQILGWSLRLYISNKLPGDVHTAGLQSIQWVARICGVSILVLA